MGAWSYQILCDDTSLDAIDELLDSDNAAVDIERFLDDCIECGDDYVDFDAGEYALCAAAIVDASINGVDCSVLFEDERDDDDEYVQFMKSLAPLTALRGKSAKVLELILSDSSELRELWEENERLYPKWKEIIEKVLNRLA